MSPTALEEQVLADLQREMGERSARAHAKVDAVSSIDENTLRTELQNSPNAARTDFLNKISEAIEELVKVDTFSAESGLPNPNFADRVVIFDKLRSLVQAGIIAAPVINYFKNYETFLNLKNKLNAYGPNQSEGIFNLAYTNLQSEMQADESAVGWQELTLKFGPVSQDITGVLEKRASSPLTAEVENSGNNLSPSAQKSIDNFFSKNPNLPSPIQLSLDQSALENLLGDEDATRNKSKGELTAAVDSGNPLSDQQLETAKKLLEELLRLEKDRATEKQALEILLPLRLTVSEILYRNSLNRRRKFFALSVEERRRQNQIGYFLRPEITYTPYLDRDQAKLFLDILGRDQVEWIEETASKIASANKKDSVLNERDIARLRELARRITDLNKFYQETYADAVDFTDPNGLLITTRVAEVTEAYLKWINFLLDEIGQKKVDKKGNEPVEPARNDAPEKWERYFSEILEGDEAWKRMEKWGDDLLTAFYGSAHPQESWRNNLDAARFGAWARALGKKIEQLEEAAAQARKAGLTTEQSEKEAEAARYKQLLKRYDNNRKITDVMVTYAQSRAMTSNWHDEASRKDLVAKSIGEWDFGPKEIDFFREDYDYAEQFNQVVEWLMQELTDPIGDFSSANGKWGSDNSSRDNLKAFMREKTKVKYPDVPEKYVKELVEVAYNALTFAGAQLDAFSEIHILGFSPNIAEVNARLKYYRIAPYVEFFYGAYKEPRFLIEMLGIYPPEDLIEMWKARYASYNEEETNPDGTPNPDFNPDAKRRSGDYERRINSIEWSIWATTAILEEYIPLRREDEDPIGYVIERNRDGMLKWPYPSMYRFLFDPDYVELRKKRRYTFEHWVAGYENFVAFREAIYTDISTEGKSPEEAVTFLMKKFGEITDKISGLKSAQDLVDWNYIFVLVMSFIDRMFISLYESGNSTQQVRNSLLNQVSKIFGYQGDPGERFLQQIAFAGSERDPHLPNLNIEQNKNNLNSASAIDRNKLRPPSKRRKKANGEDEKEPVGFLQAGKKVVRTFDGKDGDRNSDRRKMKVQLSHLVGDERTAGKVVRFLEDRHLVGFEGRFPSFARTIDILSSTVAEQAKPKGESEKK